jgi:hypothetical protein
MRIDNNIALTMASKFISVDTVIGKHKSQVHIALVIQRGKVLAVASNSVGSRSRGCGYGTYTIHAERAAIKKVGDMSKLNGATLVVIRVMKGTREIGNSEPCHSCKCHLEKCMRRHGLKQVYYSA